MATKVHSIDDTALAPYVIADGVVMELLQSLDGAEAAGARRAFDELSQGGYRDYSDALGQTAERLYENNEEFRKTLNARGDAGRDSLYSFMRHWVSGMVRKEYGEEAFRALPEGFAVGREPEQQAPSLGR